MTLFLGKLTDPWTPLIPHRWLFQIKEPVVRKMSRQKRNFSTFKTQKTPLSCWLTLRSHHPLRHPFQLCSACSYGTEKESKTDFNVKPSLQLCTRVTAALKGANLFVHQHVDDGVVQCWALGKEGAKSCCEGMEGSSLVHEDPCTKSCIWGPGQEEAEDHQDAHACHFPLSFLGRLWLLLLGCSLNRLNK